ncbi:MAG TPA: lysine transporter LysE, partial [Acidimicrobiia bacterium]
ATPPGHLARTYARFLGLTMVNPLTVVYFTSLVLGLTAADERGPAAAVAFVVGAFIASMSWQTLLASIGAVAGHGLSPRFQMLAAVVGNLFVVAMAVRIAL